MTARNCCAVTADNDLLSLLIFLRVIADGAVQPVAYCIPFGEDMTIQIFSFRFRAAR